jgi:WhiB family transcriptional regulator, redox-sensing transcriptional regulator
VDPARCLCGSPLVFVPSHTTAAKWTEPPPELAAICARCPVRQECLDEAMADPATTGVWGGTVDRQRADCAAGPERRDCNPNCNRTGCNRPLLSRSSADRHGANPR